MMFNFIHYIWWQVLLFIAYVLRLALLLLLQFRIREIVPACGVRTFRLQRKLVVKGWLFLALSKDGRENLVTLMEQKV